MFHGFSRFSRALLACTLAVLAGAARVYEATYSYPFQNHACMEVMNATALYTPEKCEVWTPTQNAPRGSIRTSGSWRSRTARAGTS